MKFKYIGRFPMWTEVGGKTVLLNSGDIVESSKMLTDGFERIDAPAPAPEPVPAPEPEQTEAPKKRRKRRTVDASSTETSSVW